MLHVVGAILAVTIPWQAPRSPRPEYVVLQPLDTIQLGPLGGGEPPPARVRRPAFETAARDVEPPPPDEPPDTTPVPTYDPDARLVPMPRVGDGRLWVGPRPALPGAVADVLYGSKDARDSAVIGRLKVMVDSLNQVVDEMQRNQRRPSWTVGGESGSPKFGIDSQYIHVAGIKIPTVALALLGNLLPQGNFDESVRARHFQAMREDLLQAAARAQTFQDFRRYVREMRERKQAERDAERRRRAQDTTRAVPADSTRPIP